MALAEALSRSLIQDHSPSTRNFLRFFGTLCSIPSVVRVACELEGAIIRHWVQLGDDDEAGQDAIYDALRRFQAAEGTVPGTSEVHIIFADEDESAIPATAEVLFVRE